MREATKKKWAARVAAWRASGLTSSEFCQNKSYKPGTLRLWSHLLGQPEAARDTPGRSPAPRLARVQCVPAASAAGADKSPGPPQAALVLHVAQGALAIAPGFDPATLASLLAVLEQPVPTRRTP